MDDFGKMRPSFFGRVLLAIVRMGFSRGRVKRLVARLWRNYAGADPVDILYHGLKLRLVPFSNETDTKILCASKFRDKVEVKAMARMLAGGGVFLDVGANIGYYALMAVKCGASKAYAFEPIPEMAERCRMNAQLNDFGARLEVFDFALGDKKGKAKLRLSTDAGQSSMVVQDVGKDVIEVEIRPLAEVISTLKIKDIDVMKIDVEGMEDRVLRPFFENVSPQLYPKMLIIEDHHKAYWRWDVIDWMLAHGYRITKRTKGNVILVR